jgi:LemA protein
LKASQNFIELQKSLADIEDQIQLARRYYNGAARNFNILIQSFPSNLVANTFHFTPVEYFEIEAAAERAVPKVAFP